MLVPTQADIEAYIRDTQPPQPATVPPTPLSAEELIRRFPVCLHEALHIAFARHFNIEVVGCVASEKSGGWTLIAFDSATPQGQLDAATVAAAGANFDRSRGISEESHADDLQRIDRHAGLYRVLTGERMPCPFTRASEILASHPFRGVIPLARELAAGRGLGGAEIDAILAAAG